jgi:hypothetical protein
MINFILGFISGQILVTVLLMYGYLYNEGRNNEKQ